MNWFKQSSGVLRNELMAIIGEGYAGREEGKNNPAMENVKGIGPLPAGIWTGVELIEEHPILGKYVIHLEPDEETRKKVLAYGRNPDSFYMHGDSKEHPGLASHGCIVEPQPTREYFWTKTDRKVKVCP